MPGGYYDPETPGHAELSQVEVLKVMGGSFSAAIGGWLHYVGAEEGRDILRRIVVGIESGEDYLKVVGEVRTHFEHLKLCCYLVLGALATAWEGVVGREHVLQTLGEIVAHDATWEEWGRLAREGTRFLQDADQRRADPSKGAN